MHTGISPSTKISLVEKEVRTECKANQALEFFAASDAKPVASTANAKDGTIDVVWYTGRRFRGKTPPPAILHAQARHGGRRFDRLNNGAPVFDTHFTGDDFKSVMAGKVGTRAQVGVVSKAWPNGDKGMATLQVRSGRSGRRRDVPQGQHRHPAKPQLRNLRCTSARSQTEEGSPEGKPPYLNDKEIGMFKATDWEPFEISAVHGAGRFQHNVFSPSLSKTDAISTGNQPTKGETCNGRNHHAGHGRGCPYVNEQALAAAREEAVQAERERVSEIQSLGATAIKYGIDGDDLSVTAIAKGVPVDQSAGRTFAPTERRRASPPRTATGRPIRGEGGASVTRDGMEAAAPCMQMALLLRADGRFFLARRRDHNGNDSANISMVAVPEQQQARRRDGAASTAISSSSNGQGVPGNAAASNPRGMDVTRIAELALQGPSRGAGVLPGGAESTSDFPAILANVANKTLRQGYEAYPRTFQPFCRQVTAQDFKPINRVMLADAPALQPLNEKGEYHRANLTDNNINYSLGTYGEIVALTRKVIINDDLQAFTRVPAIARCGGRAARIEHRLGHHHVESGGGVRGRQELHRALPCRSQPTC